MVHVFVAVVLGPEDPTTVYRVCAWSAVRGKGGGGGGGRGRCGVHELGNGRNVPYLTSMS